MGIFDFFSKNKYNNEDKKKQNIDVNENNYPEMELKYRDGTRANIKFKEVVNYELENGKSSHLQEIEIFYFDEKNQFERKVCYIDPVALPDKNGNNVYNSAKYFESLKASNLGLAKAFFKKNEIAKLPSNYIGSLSIHQDNRNPSRSFNQKNGFYADYVEQYKRKEQERLEQAQQQSNKFSEEIKSQINKPYEVHYKDSHAEVLTPQMRDERFGKVQR